VLYRDTEARERAIKAGGKWDKENKCWNMQLNQVLKPGLEKRIIGYA